MTFGRCAQYCFYSICAKLSAVGIIKKMTFELCSILKEKFKTRMGAVPNQVNTGLPKLKLLLIFKNALIIAKIKIIKQFELIKIVLESWNRTHHSLTLSFTNRAVR